MARKKTQAYTEEFRREAVKRRRQGSGGMFKVALSRFGETKPAGGTVYNLTPKPSSSWLIRLLTADFDTPSLAAALEKLPLSTTATKTGIAENLSISLILCSYACASSLERGVVVLDIAKV